ncbi:PspA/IM30 family protein [bacterium]|nr:PspA/IM30 family protein [bacterium]
MGILARFKDIMESNINAFLDKCEDPAKMIDQTLRNLREDLADVKKETAAVMADEKNAQRKLDECKNDIQKFTVAAQNALKSGNEDDAKKLIAKKQQYDTQLVEFQKTYDVAHANAEKMRQMHDKLSNDIDELETRKDSIKAKIQVAKAQQKVNKIVSGSKDSEASLSAFERLEARANKMLDAAEAEAELNTGLSKSNDLAAQYTSGSSASVDAELEAMKAALGLTADTNNT